MIADDFPAIAHRLAQLAKERRREVFAMPEGVLIIPRNRMRYGMKIPLCDLCFVLDERAAQLMLIADGSRSNLRHPLGVRFIDYLSQFYPSLRPVSAFEARLSHEESAHLLRHLEEQ